MNNIGISTDPNLLDVELPRTLIESPSVSTFLPDEEASICPLLSNTNGTSTPLTFSHPLTPNADNDSNASANLVNEDTKAETSSSTGSSSGIGMDVTDTAATSLFNKHAYQHLQKNNGLTQDSNGHGLNGNLNLSKDTPSFVSWNWPLIRKCTFFVFMSSLLAMCAVVVAMIITLPRTCNPKTAWYRGSVFYEIFPASFQDSNNDGLGDIRGITNRIEYLESIGVAAIRLNSIFPSKHYPDDYKNITSLIEIADLIGTDDDLLQLAETLHARNISLVLDLPIYPFVEYLSKTNWQSNIQPNVTSASIAMTLPTGNNYIETVNVVTQAMHKWIDIGVDGFYVKGLEHFAGSDNLIDNMVEWKHIMGSNRVLIISELVLENLEVTRLSRLLNIVDLVDVHLDILNGTENIKERIKQILSGNLKPRENGVWIQWSLGGVDSQRITPKIENGNATLAATLMQLMLPGTPNIFYGDEIALENAYDPLNEHKETKHLHHLATMQWSDTAMNFTNKKTLPWLPESASYTFENYEMISKMIALRDRSPSIYKNSICKSDTALPNTQIRSNHNDIIVIERVYPRRNSFVSVSNFGQKRVTLDMTSIYYSGHVMLGKTRSEKLYFDAFEIGSMETIIVKLDK